MRRGGARRPLTDAAGTAAARSMGSTTVLTCEAVVLKPTNLGIISAAPPRRMHVGVLLEFGLAVVIDRQTAKARGLAG
jgi:hypothetical protein